MSGISRTFLVTLLCCVLACCAVKDVITGYDRERVVCPLKSFVWGPGLEANFNVPARFFFIQAMDFENNSFTYSPGPNAFQVSIKPTSGRGRIWTQVLDRNDGSFIVRFRLFESYREMRIEVKSGERHVKGSPFLIADPMYDEKCFCPEQNQSRWQSDMHCELELHPQISQDLSIFPTIDLDRLATEAVDRFARHHSLCHYTIINNKVYRKTHGQHVGFKMFSDAFLLSLARKVRLPDVEFFINLGDWPLEKRTADNSPLPILSWCGSDETRDIVMPTYDITESTLETLGRVTLDMMSVQANTGPKWINKTNKAFWRGRDSRRERLNLVKLSRDEPELIDAALTNFFFFRNEEAEYGPKVKHISFFDFFKYKYQINIDGTVAAYRLPYLLSGDSAVLKHESVFYEHFYKQLEPWVHYIPFKKDLSDIVDKIKWAQTHDEEAQRIAHNAQQFARENLMSNDIFCYYLQLLQEYAKRQTGPPVIREGMELVEQPQDTTPCHCSRLSPAHEEL
ncbi:protein O-glucosyltransferase 2-like [Patiria miniata]|uniref:Glycosyl transferase CAP10 domain-containing protein n=1 Tax=Patiria miniata TaxID=46514 RepID=A0A914B2K8_PATMI|nr:protein O-glucosyltransferase 2-like [Patiria miniata]